MDFRTLIAELDAAIRAGDVAGAGKTLAGQNFAKVDRELRLPLATLSRRCGLYMLGLKLLTPIVRGAELKLHFRATPHEKVEYAALLQKSRSIGEALSILSSVSPDDVPESLLYKSFCHFNRWEYADAVPHLDKYLSYPLADYAKLVGQVNLGAALAMINDHSRALEVLSATLVAARENRHTRLQANCLEILSQVYIQAGDFDGAEEKVRAASEILHQATTRDSLFILKWKAVIAAEKLKSPEPIRQLKAEAQKRGEWEVFRDAELKELKFEFQPGLLARLYFGTPYEAFRRRIHSELGEFSLPDHFRFGARSGKCLDMGTGKLDGKPWTKPGGKIHQVLYALMLDFYEPMNVGRLFSELFAGEYFNIFSSGHRVHQLIHRTRSELEKTQVPISIVEQNGCYRLDWGEDISVKVPLAKLQVDWYQVRFARALEVLSPDRFFSRKEVMAAMNLTRAEYDRFVETALAKGDIERKGVGSGVRYRCVVPIQRAA